MNAQYSNSLFYFLIQADEPLPTSEKSRLIDLRIRNRRAEEELAMTGCEMLSVLHSMENEYNTMMKTMQSNPSQHVGVVVSLREKAEKIKNHYLRCNSIFSHYISTPEIPSLFSCPIAIDIHVDTLQADIEAADMEDPDDDSDEEI